LRKVKCFAVLLLFFSACFWFSARQREIAAAVNDRRMKATTRFSLSAGNHGNANASRPALCGRVEASPRTGAGNITNGERDTNGCGIGTFVRPSFYRTYSIGADHRGGEFTGPGRSEKLKRMFAFAMLQCTRTTSIEFDALRGGTIGIPGTIEKRTSSAYSTVRINRRLRVSGAADLTMQNNPAIAIEGGSLSNGTGTLSNAAGDSNAYGTDDPMTFQRSEL